VEALDRQRQLTGFGPDINVAVLRGFKAAKTQH